MCCYDIRQRFVEDLILIFVRLAKIILKNFKRRKKFKNNYCRSKGIDHLKENMENILKKLSFKDKKKITFNEAEK